MTNGHYTPAYRPTFLGQRETPETKEPFPDLVKVYAQFWREEFKRDRTKELKPPTTKE